MTDLEPFCSLPMRDNKLKKKKWKRQTQVHRCAVAISMDGKVSRPMDLPETHRISEVLFTLAPDPGSCHSR